MVYVMAFVSIGSDLDNQLGTHWRNSQTDYLINYFDLGHQSAQDFNVQQMPTVIINHLNPSTEKITVLDRFEGGAATIESIEPVLNQTLLDLGDDDIISIEDNFLLKYRKNPFIISAYIGIIMFLIYLLIAKKW